MKGGKSLLSPHRRICCTAVCWGEKGPPRHGEWSKDESPSGGETTCGAHTQEQGQQPWLQSITETGVFCFVHTKTYWGLTVCQAALDAEGVEKERRCAFSEDHILLNRNPEEDSNLLFNAPPPPCDTFPRAPVWLLAEWVPTWILCFMSEKETNYSFPHRAYILLPIDDKLTIWLTWKLITVYRGPSERNTEHTMIKNYGARISF